MNNILKEHMGHSLTLVKLLPDGRQIYFCESCREELTEERRLVGSPLTASSVLPHL
jgi:hypothetical protein